MKIGRRGFLGMAAAAPLAAPKAVQSIGQSIGGASAATPIAWFDDPNNKPDESGWIRQRIAELKKRRDDRKDDSPPDFENHVRESINSLRSVSPAYKEIMMDAAQKRYDEQRSRWFIDNEIKELMERANVIGISIF